MPEKTIKVKLEVREAKETKRKYLALVTDLGYTKKVISVDKATMAEILDIKVSELAKYISQN